jgi:signal transduction histidine kinase
VILERKAALLIIMAATVIGLTCWPLYWLLDSALETETEQRAGNDLLELSLELSRIPQDRWHELLERSVQDNGYFFYLTPLAESARGLSRESIPLWQHKVPESLHLYLQPLESWSGQLDERDLNLIESIPGSEWELELVVRMLPLWPAGLVLGLAGLSILYLTVQWALQPIGERNSRVAQALATVGDASQDTETMALAMTGELVDLRKNARINQDEWRDLLHGVAHELRSPAARISFALSEWKSVTTKEERIELESTMDRAIDDLNHLVQEVLRYSRLDLSSETIDLQSCNLEDIVNECCARIKPLYPEVEIQLSGQSACFVLVNEVQFSRAVINLVRNAARYSSRNLAISWQLSSSDWTLTVEDDGPGIPPGKRERIFEPFTRLDPSRSRDSGGSGLGLAIVKTVAVNHCGTVVVDDSTLGGARFTMSLPLNPPRARSGATGSA